VGVLQAFVVKSNAEPKLSAGGVDSGTGSHRPAESGSFAAVDSRT
jgi:hypothetical protein